MSFNNCYNKIQEMLTTLEQSNLTQEILNERGFTFFGDELIFTDTKKFIIRHNTQIDRDFDLSLNVIDIFFSNWEEMLVFDGKNFFITAPSQEFVYYHPHYLTTVEIIDWLSKY